MEWKDYAEFTVTDFLTDDFFMEWVLHPDPENQSFWEEWQQLYPEKRPVIAEARSMLLSLEYRRHELPAESYDRIWLALHKKMEQSMPGTETMPFETAARRTGKWRKVAIYTGVCSMLALGVYWLLRPKEKQELFTSQFGENRRLLLPDSSVVILGPHSVLKAAVFSETAKTREVWLEGEAYFMVKEVPGKAQPFTVHAGDLNIEVLGTEFNVNNYSGKPSVVLHSGKVAVKDRQQDSKRIIMQPGEMVEYRPDNKAYVRRKVSTEKYVAWVNRTLVFDSTSLEEVAEQLHHKFGIRLQFADSSLPRERFSATLKQADHKVVLKAISEAFGAEIDQQDHETFVLRR